MKNVCILSTVNALILFELRNLICVLKIKFLKPERDEDKCQSGLYMVIAT